ncbi:hypothetical protein RCU45_00145 [Escherichia coli]|nr:hypothetical protein [Escherichia coli]MED0087109.1 hypothetical protein [Escherichia coli]MED0555759.1 hypothetical protein [Escherichia coli]MED9015524.1 hypothetical protein [Escherichia coli]MED9028694.1 hypothetical protein [Escherichia coli]
MSLVNLFSGKVPQLSVAVINTVQTTARAAGIAHINVCGRNYSVHHVKTLDGFCVKSEGNGLLDKLLGNRKVEARTAVLERQFNYNCNPIRGYNEHYNIILESRI